MRKPKSFLLPVLAVLVTSSATVVNHAQSAAPAPSPPDATLPFRNPALPIEQRVNDLVSRMKLEEKVLQMQHTSPAIPRLGVPSYDWWSEALHGVARSGYATVFPQAIGMAATWDAELVHQEGEIIAVEGRAKYNQAQRENNHLLGYGLTFWSPNINIFRDPRWGRGQETYGEDPYLTARLGVAFVTGLQGTDPKYLELVATPKHYAVHSGPESRRHGFNVQVSPHDLEDTYLPAFRATVTEGHADSVMCAYNAIDGEPACANTYLLQKTLRDAWKFKGYVTSDCGAVGDITAGHHFTPDNEHGSVAAVRAGSDTTCGDEYAELVKAVHDGLIKESEIDVALKRLVTARIRLGMFDPPDAVPFNKISMAENDTPAHSRVALRAARESMVLLKNEAGLLPFGPNVKTIAVVGPNADSLSSLEGNYNGTPSHPVTPVDGIEKVFAGRARILYSQGSAYLAALPLPVPRSVFHLADRPETIGLKAEYFANPDLSGKPAITRTDPAVQFDWNADSPARGIPMQAFSVRWTGTFTPPVAGEYPFSLSTPHCYPCGAHDTFRVFVDDTLAIDASRDDYSWKPDPPAFKLTFNDNKPHVFRLEYVHRSPRFAAGIVLNWQPPEQALRDEAVKIASQADVVVAFVGLSPELEGEEMPVHVEGFDGGDRTDIGLPRSEQDLLEALGGTGKPLVVVLLNGSAVAATWASEHAGAVLDAWYPGELGGTAIAETLSGANNPAGRLPVTFYASLDQLPPFEEYSMQNRTYRYFSGQPLYPFGFGLSYATFAYSGVKLSNSKLAAGQSLTVEADVRNTSKVAGDEVAELYLSPPAGGSFYQPASPPSGWPVLLRELKGFKRVHLPPGETRHISFTLSPRDLSQVDENGDHIVLPGRLTVTVGGGQPGSGAASALAEFEITGQQKLPR